MTRSERAGHRRLGLRFLYWFGQAGWQALPEPPSRAILKQARLIGARRRKIANDPHDCFTFVTDAMGYRSVVS